MFNSYKDKLRYNIQQEITRAPSSGMGIVRRTHAEAYACDVWVVENNDPRLGHMALNVPIPMVGGLSYAMPHQGDRVLLTFLNGDVNFPNIVAVYPSSPIQTFNQSFIESSTVAHMADMR
jgi:hypothetical protein